MLIKRWFGSLVNRAVVFVVLVILLSAVAVTIAGSVASYSELKEQAETQVATIADLVATDLDNRLAQRRGVLSHVAEGLTMEADVFETRAPLLARRQVALQHLFDGVFFFDASGNVLAEYPDTYGLAGRDVRHRDYFRLTSSQLTPLISEPFRSYLGDQPVIMVTAPVFDHRKKFIGMLGGAIALDGSFLEEASKVRVGRSGYVGVGTRNGITVVHGARESIMAPIPEENPALLRAMEGFEGTVQVTNSRGMDTIISVRQLSQVPWFVAAVWPAEEAYAPVGRIGDVFAWVLFGVIAVLAPVALLVFRRLMLPLLTLGKQISQRHLGLRTSPVDERGGREIRKVAQTFNTLMEERSEVLASLAEREAFFRSLTRSAPIGIIQTDVLGRIEFVNPAMEEIAGQEASFLRRTYLAEGLHEDDRAQALDAWYTALRSRHAFRSRMRLNRLRDGKPVWLDVMTAAIETREKSMGTVTAVRDITHELEVEAELREEQARAESILGVLHEGVLMVDSKGVIRYANRAACSFVGTQSSCMGENFFQAVTIENDRGKWSATDFLESENIASLYAVVRNIHGVACDADITMLHLRRGEGNERLVFVLRDISERRREEERLSWEATHDSLTGLLNRRAFNNSLEKSLSETSARERPGVLVLVDLDYFKPVNDQGGHLVGDDLLRRLADFFKGSVRQADAVARLGGDEFAIILPGCSLGRAAELAEQIRAGVEAIHVEGDGRTYRVTTSIGLTELSPADSGTREVIARADEGCYMAKAQGRNRVVVIPADRRPTD